MRVQAAIALFLGIYALAHVASAGTVSTILEEWLEDAAYRLMNITVSFTFSNTLEPWSPPPWSPVWGPMNATLTCNNTVLEPGQALETITTITLPSNVSLGLHVVASELTCSYLAWQRHSYEICTTTCTRTFTTTTRNRTVTITWTECCGWTTRTVTWTRTMTTWLRDTATVTVIPRSLNQSYIPLDIDCSWPAPGETGNCTLRLWNLAGGVTLANVTLLELNPHMLLLHEPELLVVSGNETLLEASWEGYTWPASRLDTATTPQPAAVEEFRLQPSPPHRTYTITVMLGASADNETATYRQTVAWTYAVIYPYGWAIVVDDECRIVTWTPVADPTVTTMVADTRPPRVELRSGRAVVVDPGRCGGLANITLLRDAGVYRVYMVEGRVFILPPLPPGNYTIVAVDQAGNSATGAIEVREAGYRPEAMWPTLLALLLTLAAVSLMTRGRW